MIQARRRKQLDLHPKRNAAFIEPMECLAVSRLPAGAQWVWEIKLDGYRAIAVRSGGAVDLFSRREKSLSKKFPYIVEALAGLPEGTVVDGELVALDDRGRPEFNLLQNFRGAAARIHYYIFDLLCYEGRDLTRLPLVERRALLKSLVAIRDKRIRIPTTSRLGRGSCWPPYASSGLRASSGSERTASTNPGNAAARGSSIAWIVDRSSSSAGIFPARMGSTR